MESQDASRPLRFLSFLAPKMFPVYHSIVECLGRRLGCTVQLENGARVTIGLTMRMWHSSADWHMVELSQRSDCLEPIAAPVLKGGPLSRQADLLFGCHCSPRTARFNVSMIWQVARGRTTNLSRNRVTGSHDIILFAAGKPMGFFRQVVEAGWHERSIELVRSGAVDASAIGFPRT
ncbi:MAG: hypothetical protein KatS3mg105_4780 [Gemmatales bacterium]|nr:MAG: hypothetical protein KatS3mg105_4780 [Gemmatales bacterium]